MSTLSNTPVLVLNASYEPIHVASAKRALVLVVKEVAGIEEDTGREVHPGIMCPSVIRLKEMRRVPPRVQALSRNNILLRDRYECQYCGAGGRLTLDHVLPRSRGGLNRWENLVACCISCNQKKDNKTPEEAGMTLRRKPRPMTIHTSKHILRSMGESQESWKKYLYYN